GVLYAVPAPGGADARLHGAQRLAVRVPGLEAHVGQAFPDPGELLDPRAEQVDPLRAGDLGIEPELARDLADDDELLRRDLAARPGWHDGVRPVPLQVGEEVVVGVLQGRLFPVEDVAAAEAREDRGDGRLADVAAAATPVLGDQPAERRDAAHPYDVEQLGPA